MVPAYTIDAIRSEPLVRAWQLGNLQAQGFTQQGVVAGIWPGGDGVFEFGHPNFYAPEYGYFLPFSEAGPGQTFSMRLYGWRALSLQDNNPNTAVWIPQLLAELLCTTSNINGAGTDGGFKLKPTEYLCDTIVLTQGFLGAFGSINSTGPGTDLVARAKIDLDGCRYLSFDGDTQGMNCLWSKS